MSDRTGRSVGFAAVLPARLLVMWLIDAGSGIEWRDYRYPDQPPWLAVSLKLAPTTDGVAVAGVQVHRRDGRAVTARDLRLVKMPPNWVLWGESASRWYEPPEGTPAMARPAAPQAGKGPQRHDDEHWRAVYALWRAAQEEAPRAPVKWMLASRRWPITDATMRRWIARARERASVLSWDNGGAA
jgi:hypothetical protein